MIEHKLSAGDMLTLCIEETNMMGNGVAKVDDMVVFCVGTVAGDVVIALITEVKKNYAMAKALKFLQYSPCRTEARCAHSTECGGCAFSGVTYEHELFVKKSGAEASFRRCGSFTGEIEKIVPSNVTEYRNKAVFHFDKDGNTGYYARGTHSFVKIENCPICHSAINNIRKESERILKGISFSGEFTYLYIRYMKRCDEASVVLGYKGEESLILFAKELAKVCPNVKCVMTGKGADPAKDTFSPVWGEETVNDEFFGMKMKISPKSFYQVNTEGAEELCRAVVEFAELCDGDSVLDLYCGIGTIGLAVAKSNPNVKVYGVEINKKAVENAKENAKNNRIENAEFFAGDSADFAEIIKEINPGCIVIDPPRAGLSDKTVRQIMSTNVEKIVYVSCNPSTMSRDLKKLSEMYKMKKSAAVDMFPGTQHVETVILLSRV